MITIKTDRLSNKVFIHIKDLEKKNKRALWKSNIENGKELERETKRLILNGPKTGRLYKNKDGGWHQASAPGQAPANRSGKLFESTGFKVRNWREFEIGETVEHAKMEHNWGRIKARPHLIKAIENKKWDMAKNIEIELKRELKH